MKIIHKTLKHTRNPLVGTLFPESSQEVKEGGRERGRFLISLWPGFHMRRKAVVSERHEFGFIQEME